DRRPHEPARLAGGRHGRQAGAVGRTAKERGLFRQRKRPGYWPRRAVSSNLSVKALVVKRGVE
ncbi:MAG: hypothetical protein KKH28_02320, partial [Elusimicrobia bacterium]|nr:hypothetical protein [Elusimicrobiota bacterium]